LILSSDGRIIEQVSRHRPAISAANDSESLIEPEDVEPRCRHEQQSFGGGEPSVYYKVVASVY